MIISPSHTLEYKPNDIIITSSIGDVLLHHPNIIASFPGSTSKDLGGGASVLILTLGPGTFAVNYRAGARNAVYVSRREPWRQPQRALECAPLCRALRDRPDHAGSDSREEGSIWESTCPKLRRNVQIPHAFFPWLYPM